MTVGSLFSGVGGFDLGFEQAGFTVAWQVERDEQARKVLRHRWPHVPIYDDVQTVGAHNLTPVDVLVGGFPCQDLSVAGQRKGLSGGRSGLFFEFMRIAAELRPSWVLIENVPGLFTSDGGRDFHTVLATLADIGFHDRAYRVLDSRHFGVAQRRRRVFIVGCAGAEFGRAGAVLLEPARRGRHPAPGGEAGQGIAGASTGGALNAGESQRRRIYDGGGLAPTLSAEEGRGCGAPTVVAFDTTQITSHLNHSNPKPGDPCHPLAAGAHPPTVAFGVHANQRGELRTSDLAGSLTSTRSGKQFEGVMTEPGEHLVPDLAPCLETTAGDYSRADGFTALPSQHGVRRLTPLECERLQGFPDGWSCLCPAQGDTATCVCPDSPRYKQMGNAVTVPVIRWIAERLMAEAIRQEVAS